MASVDGQRNRLFISYSRKDALAVYAFADALARAGIDVWIDRAEIEPLEDFPARIRDGLASSHALLAWYSRDYSKSGYCLKELTAAWICSQHLSGGVRSRILIVAPDNDIEHIVVGDLRTQSFLIAPQGSASLASCAETVSGIVSRLSGTLGDVSQFAPPRWHPSTQRGSARFVGRLPELWSIHTALQPVRISPHEDPEVIVQLPGLGGVGKTMLAIEYAKRFGASYPGGVYWLRAYGFDTGRRIAREEREQVRQQQLVNFALLHGIPVQERSFREVAEDLVRTLAEREAYLWIVDDLPPGLTVDSEFSDWCAPTPNGHTLITTRSNEYDGLGVTVPVGVLAREDALQLLCWRRKPSNARERGEAQALVEDLGRHALAVDIAGHFLLRTNTFAELRAELLQDKANRLEELVADLRGQLPGGHEKSIVQTVLRSITQLSNEGLTLLRLACTLEDGTPVSFRLAVDTLADALGLGRSAARDFFARAVNQGEMHTLITVALGGTGGDAVSVHPLVRYTVVNADPAGEEARALRLSLKDSAVVTLARILEDVEDVRNHASLEFEISHARYLATAPHTAGELRIALCLSVFEGNRGNYQQAIEIAESALKVANSVLGPDHETTLTLRNNIATVLGETGRVHEAIRLLRELLPDQIRALGAHHQDTLTTRQNIANWSGHTEGAEKAVRLLRKLHQDETRVLGSDHADTLLTQLNIAYWMKEAGNIQSARELLEQLLPSLKRVLGHNHANTLIAWNNFATWSFEAGDRRKAEQVFRELLDDQLAVLGPDHPGTLLTRYNIASVVGKAVDSTEGLRLLRGLLPDQVRKLGDHHPDTIRTMLAMAAMMKEAGAARESLPLLHDVVSRYERIRGAHHPETLLAKMNLQR